MKRSILFTALLPLLMLSLIGCGSSSTKSSCACAICINEVPASPSDSAESCEAFAAAQDCTDSNYTIDPSDTCGDEPQPVCQVSGCTGQCSCPEE